MATKNVTKESTTNEILEDLVFGAGRTLTTTAGTAVLGPTTMTELTLLNNGLHLLDTNATHDLVVSPGSNLTADRVLTLTTGDAAKTLLFGASSGTPLGLENINNGTNDNLPPSASGLFDGQTTMRNYGNLWWWNGAAWRSRYVLGGLVVNSNLDITAGTEVYFVTGGGNNPTTDNVLRLRNDNTDHYSAIAFHKSAANGSGEVGAIGFGNSAASIGAFVNRLYYESFGDLYDIVLGSGATGVRWKLFEASTGCMVGMSASGTGSLNGTETLRFDQRFGYLNTIHTTDRTATGTVTISGGAVTGSGTSFTTQLVVGSKIYTNNNSAPLIVTKITSNTAATVDSLTEASAAGSTLLFQNPHLLSLSTSPTNRSFAVTSDGRPQITHEAAPFVQLNRAGTQIWRMICDSNNGNGFGVLNLTANAFPFTIHGSTPNASFALTSAGEVSAPNGFTQDLATTVIGKTLKVKSGTNAKAGTFTLTAGAATVANTSITANSVIVVTLKTLGGTRSGNPDIVPTASTGFVATGAATDTSVYNYIILEVN